MTIQITMDMLPEGEKNGAWECSEHYFFPHTQTLMEKKEAAEWLLVRA